MKTSVIRYRVADFLREHAPFDSFAMDDLLAFSGTGRVSFHEDDICLFRKGQPREPLIWVIQQGRVDMLDEAERLCDVLGGGDTLGLSRNDGADVYVLTARTATEVILYSFDLNAFETLARKYPEASHYLTADLSTSRHTKALRAPSNRERLMSEREKKSWVNASRAPVPHRRHRDPNSVKPPLPCCSPRPINIRIPPDNVAGSLSGAGHWRRWSPHTGRTDQRL